MSASNSDFRVRNGIVVIENAAVGGNTTIGNNAIIGGIITANGSGHTISGNSNYGSSTLHINAVNKRAVINAVSTTLTTNNQLDWAFEVVGKQRVTSNLSVGGNSALEGNVVVGVANSTGRRQLTITGNLQAQSSLSVTGNTTISGNSISIGGGTTPNTVIEGNVWIKGAIKTGAAGDYYDLDDLNAATGAVPILKVYNVGGTQVFP
jgi:hypothetical protein